MHHYKCGACRIRLQITQPPPAPGVLFCPECHAALDRIADLTELIGLRRIPSIEQTDRSGNESAGSLDEPAAAAIAIPHHRPSQ
jgi:hypothetical protein